MFFKRVGFRGNGPQVLSTRTSSIDDVRWLATQVIVSIERASFIEFMNEDELQHSKILFSLFTLISPKV